MKKFNYIDLFSGCGGLTEGFEVDGRYNILAAVEWEKRPMQTLEKRLEIRWENKKAKEICINFDIQRTNELLYGWKNDKAYGDGKGLKHLTKSKKVDLIIGGPPCQAYSIAGRIRDRDGMQNDYRNYLFESYIKIVNEYKPQVFIFENVPGILSAKPGGVKIVDEIRDQFKKNGYVIIENLKEAIINVADYGIPQNRRRIIIMGIRQDDREYSDIQNMLKDFYSDILLKYTKEKMTVYDAIGDMQKFYPLYNTEKKKNLSHTIYDVNLKDHLPRFHNDRDIGIFKKLAYDKFCGEKKYNSTDKKKELYTLLTGKKSNIHKYHVIDWSLPSTTIVSHLHKDGLRYIHPDHEQARSITIREAARLQSFEDDFEFLGSQGDKYKMIGNAVPPKFANILAKAIIELFNKYFIQK